MSLTQDQYKETIRSLSDRLVEAQRPIRILDAIKWGGEVQEAFFASKFKELPPVNREYYHVVPLGYDLQEKKEQFYLLERDVVRQLGQFNPVGQILRRMCREYQMVLRMLEARGTREFSDISQELYGAASDVFHAGDPTLADLGKMLFNSLENIDRSSLSVNDEKVISGPEAVEILQARINDVFKNSEVSMRVKVSDGIVADAAAGADYLKVRKEAFFSMRDLRLLEIHEGWVHMGTTLNGMHQNVCTFLSKGPPSSTVTQEGLAILMEIIAFASYPERLRKLTNRIQAVSKAEEGADFIEVFNYFRDQGYDEQECYFGTARVFRGSLPDLGPFTKDLSYSKGFVLIYNYIQLAVKKGKLERIPLLFCGKTNLEDMRTLALLQEEGLITPPKILPPLISDLNALAAFMCYSNFLNHLNLKRIEADYANIL
jgi:uncharacterized protein (TIGR02421 family)